MASFALSYHHLTDIKALQVGGLGGDAIYHYKYYYLVAHTTGHYITYSPPSIVLNVVHVCKTATKACWYTISILRCIKDWIHPQN